MAFAGGRGDASLAGALLAAAALADTFDGGFARSFTRTERQCRVGRQLDSLVDIVAFGVAPVAVLAALAPPEGAGVASVWWTAACAHFSPTPHRAGL
jgi:phosphatidylserine synthase